MNKTMWVGKIVMWVVLGFFIAFGIVLGTMYLWNWLIPELFNGPVLNFWQTLGLWVLAKVFFGFGGKGSHHYRGDRWRNHWKAKWANMSPEEREKFKSKMKEKWCYRGEPGSTSGTDTSNV